MLNFSDNYYENNGFNHVRQIVRCILLDKDNKIVLEKLIRNDVFGHCEYVETPGGGVNENEDFLLALKREVKEELGYDIKVLCELDTVEDFYNLIKRKNINHYYLAKVISQGEKHLEDHEMIMFQDELHLEFDEAIALMEKNTGGVGKLVAQREVPIIKEAKIRFMELEK